MLMAIGNNGLHRRIGEMTDSPPNSDDPLVQYEFQEIKAALELDSTGEKVAR